MSNTYEYRMKTGCGKVISVNGFIDDNTLDVAIENNKGECTAFVRLNKVDAYTLRDFIRYGVEKMGDGDDGSPFDCQHEGGKDGK